MKELFTIATLDRHHYKLEFFQFVGLGSWPEIGQQAMRALIQMLGD